MTRIPIYQFCREFDNVYWSEAYQCYVSGGYTPGKITRWNRAVPEEIRKVVIDGYFKLNDNYPPAEGDFALIAREIDNKYAVLAVANKQLDDDPRPTIGYKYFWLEKSSPDVDGIGTLIYWWSQQKKLLDEQEKLLDEQKKLLREQEKPLDEQKKLLDERKKLLDERKKIEFDMAESVEKSEPEIFYYPQEYRKATFQEHWLQETWGTVKRLPSIPHTVVATKELWQEQYPEYIKLHYLALGLSLRANYYNAYNAWAWNVEKVEYPTSFLAIFYTHQKDIPNNIRKRQLSSSQQDNNDDPNSNNGDSENTQSLKEIPAATESKIKLFLSNLANTFSHQNKLDPKKRAELFGYLRDYADADWTNCIDRTTLRNASNFDIYPQLIYLIAPNDEASQKWLLNMVKSLEIGGKSTSGNRDFVNVVRNWVTQLEGNHQLTSILELQRLVLKASYDYDDVKIRQKLEDSIYSGISFLLEKLMNPEQNIDENQFKILAHKIDYLLTNSQSIWQEYFQKYAELGDNIILKENYEEATIYPSVKTFYQPILDIKPNLKKIDKQNRLKDYGKYKNLALLFGKTQQKGLVEFLYRMSGNSGEQIPQDVPKALTNQIRSKIFGISTTNQTTSRVITTTSNDNNNNDIGDGGAKAIFGFVIFLAASIIFFNSVRNFPVVSILIYSIVTIIAIAFTGNPLKTKKINIQVILIFVYLVVAVALLAGNVNIPNISRDIFCSNVGFLDNYKNFEKCYKSANEQSQLKIMENFVSSDPKNTFKQDQAKIANKHILDSHNEKMFNERKKKLEYCQSINYSLYSQCIPLPICSPITNDITCMKDYANFSKFYKSANEQTQLEIMESFISNDPKNTFKQVQAKIANKHILDSHNEKMFNERKKKLEFCKLTYTFYSECLTVKDRELTTY